MKEIKKNRTFYNKNNVKKALKMLKTVTDELERNKIDYYLDFGTLLGAVRDNGFIPWDHDIDITLLNEEDYQKIPKLLKKIRLNYGYRTYIWTFKESLERIKLQRDKENRNFKEIDIDFTDINNYQIAKVRTNKFLLFGKGHICLDIFFKYTHNDKLYWMAFGSIYSTSTKNINKGLTKIKLYDEEFFIPKDYDNYLKELYGNWQKPKKNWSQKEHKALEVDNLSK